MRAATGTRGDGAPEIRNAVETVGSPCLFPTRVFPTWHHRRQSTDASTYLLKLLSIACQPSRCWEAE